MQNHQNDIIAFAKNRDWIINNLEHKNHKTALQKLLSHLNIKRTSDISDHVVAMLLDIRKNHSLDKAINKVIESLPRAIQPVDKDIKKEPLDSSSILLKLLDENSQREQRHTLLTLDSKNKRQEDEDYNCPLTTDKMEEPALTSCGHYYDKKGDDYPSFLAKKECSCCRAPITEILHEDFLAKWAIQNYQNDRKNVNTVLLRAALFPTDNKLRKDRWTLLSAGLNDLFTTLISRIDPLPNELYNNQLVYTKYAELLLDIASSDPRHTSKIDFDTRIKQVKLIVATELEKLALSKHKDIKESQTPTLLVRPAESKQANNPEIPSPPSRADFIKKDPSPTSGRFFAGACTVGAIIGFAGTGGLGGVLVGTIMGGTAAITLVSSCCRRK